MRCADRALRVAEALEDRVHPALQLGELIEAHRMNLSGVSLWSSKP